jgi:SAM-dependent methyltransferase
MLRCPKCGSGLEPAEDCELVCPCGATYPRLPAGGLDFLQGGEFPDFDLDDGDFRQRAILDQECEGVAARMDQFVVPMLRRYSLRAGRGPHGLTILDCGCGNGLSVDILRGHGMTAWGLDAGFSRHRQWQQREARACLLSANALRIPFADNSFDMVLSSGLVEHLGIHEEEAADGYLAYRQPDCHSQRRQFVGELVRVLKEDGFILLDHPNGAFPADFWHGGESGSIRWHKTHGDMLPSFAEIAAYFREADPHLRLVSLSPSRRLTFHKVGVHWYGRVFAPAMKLWLEVMDIRLLSFLARSSLNPYLVTVATRRPDFRSWIYP